ncbi:MAG: periplasmic polysaccharide biosynthesis/export protein [Desulfobacteraceae bacterium]|nr:MAG: periplasmic polysaccharide biosynthesis/export protein [Desulfobacteraceae bacterium]
MSYLSMLLSALLVGAFVLGDTASAAEDGNYIIGHQDILEVSVWGQPDLQRKAEVSREGSLSLPLIGQIRAAGLSVFELEKAIEAKLADGFLKNPEVAVSVVTYQSQKVFLLGEVRKPGPYVLSARTTLTALLAEAGGLTDKAGNEITITRPAAAQTKETPVPLAEAAQSQTFTRNLDTFKSGGAEANFVLAAGDTVYVPEAKRFFVTGEVRKPGVFKWETGMTVRQAISLAGGPSERGAPNRTEIIRGKDGAEEKLRSKMPDAVLPDDVVKVPLSYF